MKKFAIASVVIAALAVFLISATSVYAQAPAPFTPPTTPGGYGRGGQMGAPLSSGLNGVAATGDGILHDTVINVYAGKLGLSVDELNARLTAGETLVQIAYAQGLTVEEINAMMAEARSQGFNQAVVDGTMTQDQADWAQTRGNRGAGMRGAGMNGTRPYYNLTGN